MTLQASKCLFMPGYKVFTTTEHQAVMLSYYNVMNGDTLQNGKV